jgi:hypothetical protein
VPTGSGGCNPYTHPTNLPLCGRASQGQFVNARPSYTLDGVGLLMDSSGGGVINGYTFANLNAGLNDEEGVKILGSNTKQIHFTNLQASYNNTGNTGKSGVYIGTGPTNITFNGGCVSTCSTQNPLTVNRQTYGFDIAVNMYALIIQGMDLTNNVSGAINIGAGATGTSLFNNSGYANNHLAGNLAMAWPTSCGSNPTGTLWNDSGTIKVCP